MSGSVTVATEVTDGREIILAYLNPGGFVGEMGLFETNPRSARIRAKTSCELGELSYKNFLSLARITLSYYLLLHDSSQNNWQVRHPRCVI